jgi:hypothetical protein
MLGPEHRRLQEVAMDARPAAPTTGPTGPGPATNEAGSAGRVHGLTALVPLAWALLLLFHPAPDANDLFGSLRREADTWLLVHLGSLLFIGLTGAVLYLLVRDLHGPLATLAKVAIGAFVLFYGAAEAIAGIATGTLVQHVADLPSDAQAPAAGVVQALWDDFVTGDLLFLVGGVGWVVAVLAAAAACRQAGAPLLATVLLALSAIAVFHAPPIGPAGLLLLAVAVVLLARPQRATVR